MSDMIWGPDTPFIDQVALFAKEFAGGRVQVAVAWATDDGAALFLDAVRGLAAIEVLVGINAQGTTVEALLRLFDAASYLGVHYRHPLLTYHPKAYVFDDGDDATDAGLIAVGSSNMTFGGLYGNVETSLVLGLADSDAGLVLTRWRAQWSSLVDSPFTARVTDPGVIEGLYRAGHVPTESERQSRRRHEASSSRRLGDREQAAGGGDTESGLKLPTEQPRRPPAFLRKPISIPFEIAAPLGDDTTAPAQDEPPQGAGAGDVVSVATGTLLFVRTLTQNDVAKLVPDDNGNFRRGTFEPDIGLGVRDLHPGLWGWPDHFTQVQRKLVRKEWLASARLFSSAESSGVDIQAMLWFREERPGHAAEFRLRLGPISVIREATPSDFGTDGVLVVCRATPGSSHDFVFRLIARGDSDWSTYDAYLSDWKPAHRFGYAFAPSES